MKTYISAKYRIDNVKLNNGYICIENDNIQGIFTLDCVTIKIFNDKIHFYLFECEPLLNIYSKSKEFISIEEVDFLESPQSYTLKSKFNETLHLDLVKRITDPKKISDIEELFKQYSK